MKSYIECYACFVRQSIEAGKLATENETLQWDILKEVLKKTLTFPQEESPAVMGKEIHRLIRRISGNPDPYKTMKDDYTHKAQEMIPWITSLIDQSENRLLAALKIIATGNIIDFGPFGLAQVSLTEFMEKKLESDFKGNFSVDSFAASLNSAQSILYVADNCGEIVFDSFFINHFLHDKKVFLSVRGGVVLNDITREDLAGIHLNENVTVIDSGDDAPGVLLQSCSQEFKSVYDSVDLVLLKGQGNYEGVGAAARTDVFSILVAKCPTIARDIGCEINDLVLNRH
ncbi:MAG: DUF89 domain-containing protein [Candidatus Xenobiia bacterium LiM19]